MNIEIKFDEKDIETFVHENMTKFISFGQSGKNENGKYTIGVHFDSKGMVELFKEKLAEFEKAITLSEENF